MATRFRDRQDAGRYLAAQLGSYANRDDVLVLGLPRGGVPVAFEIAGRLRAPLDVLLVRKLGVPGHEELALGALGSGGVIVLNEHVLEFLRPDQATIDAVVQAERDELERRERLYRGGRAAAQIAGKVVLVVDDGIATGASMRAALTALRRHRPSRLVVAVPVAPVETCAALRDQADETVCAMTPEFFYAVGAWYEDFSQTTDAEVQDLLRSAPVYAASPGRAQAPKPPGPEVRG